MILYGPRWVRFGGRSTGAGLGVWVRQLPHLRQRLFLPPDLLRQVAALIRRQIGEEPSPFG